jgi:hypothetical protein
MKKLILTVALIASVALSGCSKQPEPVVAKAAPVKAVTLNYDPPAAEPVATVEVSETAVANCVAETRKLEANKDLPKKLSGFRRLAAGTTATLADCAGGAEVTVDRLVNDDTDAVTHESLWGEVRAALDTAATETAQAEADEKVEAIYSAGYQAALADAKATAAKQATADQAATLAASQMERDSFHWGSFFKGLGGVIGVIVMGLGICVVVVITKRWLRKPQKAASTPETDSPPAS